MSPRRRRRATLDRTVDDVRLALAGVRAAHDLAEALEQACVGAARITGGENVTYAMERAGTFDVVAAIGRASADDHRRRIQELARNRGFDRDDANGDGPLVVRVKSDVAKGALVVDRAAPETAAVAALYGDVLGIALDLRTLQQDAAVAAHRVHPPELVTSLLATLRSGDGVLRVALDDLDHVRTRAGDVAVDSLVAALGVHLLNATRPPNDAVARCGDAHFLVVLRQLKAPVEVVAVRLIEAWDANTPTTTISMGASLHLEPATPLDTLERAEGALRSASRVTGSQVHVASVLQRDSHS